MTIIEEHLADLHASGLSDTTIETMGVYTTPPTDIPRLMGYDDPAIVTALTFPYFDKNGSPTGFTRIKVFPPYKDKNGTRKYLQKKGSTSHLYILPPVSEVLNKPEIPLYIVEGEKKAAKVFESGMMAIGIGGLWNWKKPNSLDAIEEFEWIKWWKRPVVIVPDSDVWDASRKELRLPVYALGRELRNRGASVKVKVITNE